MSLIYYNKILGEGMNENSHFNVKKFLILVILNNKKLEMSSSLCGEIVFLSHTR